MNKAQATAKMNLSQPGNIPNARFTGLDAHWLNSYFKAKVKDDPSAYVVPNFDQEMRRRRRRRSSSPHHTKQMNRRDSDDSHTHYSDSESTYSCSSTPSIESCSDLEISPAHSLIAVDPELYERIKRAPTPRGRFQIAWWFIIYSHDKRAEYIQHLLKSGFNAPPWVTFESPFANPPFTTIVNKIDYGQLHSNRSLDNRVITSSLLILFIILILS